MGRRGRGGSIDRLLVDNVIVDRDIDMAEALNDHFASVAVNLERELPPPDGVLPEALVPMLQN